MSNSANQNQAEANSRSAPAPAEEAAALTATFLLMDAIEDVPNFVPPRVNNPTEAILIAAHALIAKLDSMETTQLEALRDLCDSLDFIAARPDVDEVPTEHERMVHYRALEADYLCNHTAANPEEMDAALRRFKKLAGL